MTYDGTDQLHPNGIHPDQHSLVTVPGKPFQFIETGDGGVVRSSGEFVDRSSWCDDPNRGLSGAALARCKQMLSRIPSELQSMGFDLSTPATPGHIFEVRYNATTGQSTWTNRSYNFGDLPANDVAYDAPSGDLYASTDFGVFRLESGTTTWTDAAPGMPNVEVAGLTYVGKDRILYAATHGLGAWRLNLG